MSQALEYLLIGIGSFAAGVYEERRNPYKDVTIDGHAREKMSLNGLIVASGAAIEALPSTDGNMVGGALVAAAGTFLGKRSTRLYEAVRHTLTQPFP